MATDQHAHPGRRQHFHRNRRGHDRRGDRRPSGPPQTQHEPAAGGTHGHVDVDQIVREIKARIAQRHGIDLSAQQIQELAARRLEAILDPRTVKPGLLDQLRKAAGAPADVAPAEPGDAYTFEDHTIYDTHNGLLRAIRRLLAPIVKLFFNPNPISAALNAQVRVNREAARRESDRERTQAEWNALHYTILQRLVTEVSRVSLEVQNLTLRLESLAARADFTERRIRGLEAPPAPPKPLDLPIPAQGQPPRQGGEGAAAEGSGDGTRRRRRRRRGRRGNLPGGDAGAPSTTSPQAPTEAGDTEAGDTEDDGFEDAADVEAGELEAVEMIDAAPEAEVFTPPAPDPPPAVAESAPPPSPPTSATTALEPATPEVRPEGAAPPTEPSDA